MNLRPIACGLLIVAGMACAAAAEEDAACRIEVVEQGSRWPVPLVELRTTHELRLVTDNAGVIACDVPELLGRETWFFVASPGYEVPADGFGYRGVRLTPERGKKLTVEVTRTSIAHRLGRLTGGGQFAESHKLGERRDWKDGPIVGCDSIQAAEYRGRSFWIWGDTSLARYPLGIFHASAATTPLKPLTSLEPPLHVPFDYFADKEGRPRGVATLPGTGPTWLTGLATLPDATGRPRLVAAYQKVKPPLEAYELGLCAWHDERAEFERLRTVWTKSAATPKQPPYPEGHVTLAVDRQGKTWALFGNPLPRLRCPATFEAWQDAKQWETLRPQTELVDTKGAKVKPHTGSIAWNPYRRRWVTAFMEAFGKPSAFGELWYAEAASPTGPWGPAVKVLSHDNYTFYNPRLRPEWSDAAGKVLLFEGTYTQQFANRPFPTPRYDYNQVLYRLDLDDPRLAPAAKLPADNPAPPEYTPPLPP